MTDPNHPDHADRDAFGPSPVGGEQTQPLRGWTPPSPSAAPSQPAPPAYPAASEGQGLSPIPPPSSAWGSAQSSAQSSAWGAPQRYYPPAAAATSTPGRPSNPPGGVSGWVWPAVAVIALVLGLVGGALGAAGYQQVTDNTRPGTVQGGLEAVETQEAAPLDAENGSVPAVAQALLPSTVQILASFEGEQEGATGSGFVLDRQGHIVTNNHVVASAAQDEGPIKVVDHEGNRFDATVVGRSPVYDLAVLSVEDASSLQPAALGASQVLHVGDPVVAFGSPLGLSQTVTSGIVSALNRPVTTGDSDNESSYINAVQTDAAINPGNSGGPLVNLAGEVVGVNSAIATTGGGFGGEGAGNIGVGFAIPIEQVRTTADQILRTGEAQYPVIGAQVRTGGASDVVGAQITKVMPDTPAERAGLAKDDLITEVDGSSVTDGIALIVAIRTHQPGETIEFTVVRGGDERRIKVTLAGEVG